MNPENAIIGDETGVGLPQAQPDETHIAEVKKKAKYSRSKEFAELKENMEQRIKLWQTFLPGSVPVTAVSKEERGHYWAIADAVIAELRMVIDGYESAEELSKDL